MSGASGGMDAKAFLQELKTNRKTQAAAVGFLAVLGFAGYTVFAPDPPKRSAAKPGGAATGNAPAVSLDTRQTQALKGLPDLARLGKAGELPGDAKMRRDLFLFDGPPKPYVPPPPPPPPPPPTPEEIAARELQAAKDIENSQKPNDLRYIGFLATKKTGKLGAFIKNSEPLTLRVGEFGNPRWKLVEITDKAAIFQNIKFADLRHSLENRESAGGGALGAQSVTNEF
jgi:hypothetical protein